MAKRLLGSLITARMQRIYEYNVDGVTYTTMVPFWDQNLLDWHIKNQ
tara:strand:- start:423 stop:563 length:141 start_codon:yes stop_codon:yes gene_type:complete